MRIVMKQSEKLEIEMNDIEKIDMKKTHTKRADIKIENNLYEKMTTPGMTLTLCFLVPLVIMLTLFAFCEIFPFGDRSFLFSDMYHQYMPFFSEFVRKVREGDSLFYSYNVGIGTNFVALYSYYLGSPLNWLALLVPEAYLCEFMSYLVVFKMGLCGLTAGYYLQKRFGSGDFGVVFFACFYALSGYMAAYNWNIMWLDGVVLLPLILFALERLVKEGKCGLYCLLLGLSILINYYISIMICIFLVLYFVVLLIEEKGNWRTIFHFALYSLLAGGLAAVLLIPSAMAILETEFGGNSLPETLESYFPVADMLARHGMCVETELKLENWPNIYCGVAVFLLVPLYATNEAISIKKRFLNLALAGFMLISFSTNMLNFIWHGFNYPNSLPARQSFIYIFLVLVMCYEAYRNLHAAEAKRILYAYLATVAFVLYIEKFVDYEEFAPMVEFLTLLFVTVYAILLYLFRTQKGNGWKVLLGALALVTVIAESTINMEDTSLGTVSRSAYLNAQKDYQNLYEQTKELEDGFYRIEKFTRKTKNDGTLAGYPTASIFSSTMNSDVMELYDRLGSRHSKVFYTFEGATAFSSALLNVDYMFGTSDDYENSLYHLIGQSRNIYLYQNQVTLPFGYVAPTGYDLPVENNLETAVMVQNDLVNSLDVEGSLLTKVDSEDRGDDVAFTVPEDGIYYGRLTASGTSKIEVNGGPVEDHRFENLKDESLMYLGELKAGEKITLENGDEEDQTQNIEVQVYQLDESVLEQAIAKLSRQHLEKVVYDSTHVSGSLTLEEAGRLILSIPHEDGWSVKINGEKVEPQLFGGTFMAFDLEPGEYELQMKYVPEGIRIGLVVSLVSLSVFVSLMLVGKKRKNGVEEPEVAQ